MQDINFSILQELKEQNAILRQMLAKANEPKLGFGEAPKMMFVYANRRNNCLWYTLKGDEVVPIEQDCLTGYLEEIKFEKVTRRNKEEVKLRVFLRGDRLYCIESGAFSNFSKCLLSCIAILGHERAIAKPISISPYPGSEESVLFCDCYYDGERLYAPYSEGTNWKEVAIQAKMTCFKKVVPILGNAV